MDVAMFNILCGHFQLHKCFWVLGWIGDCHSFSSCKLQRLSFQFSRLDCDHPKVIRGQSEDSLCVLQVITSLDSPVYVHY